VKRVAHGAAVAEEVYAGDRHRGDGQGSKIEPILAEVSTSIREPNKNPGKAIPPGAGSRWFYSITTGPAPARPRPRLEGVDDRLDDIEFGEIVRRREGQKQIELKLEDL
jgi:hypothetical protein